MLASLTSARRRAPTIESSKHMALQVMAQQFGFHKDAAFEFLHGGYQASRS